MNIKVQVKEEGNEIFNKVVGHLGMALCNLESACYLISDVEEDCFNSTGTITNLFLLKDWLIYLNRKIGETEK